MRLSSESKEKGTERSNVYSLPRSIYAGSAYRTQFRSFHGKVKFVWSKREIASVFVIALPHESGKRLD